MHKLLKLEQQTDNKYINMYKATYESEKGTTVYEFASRRKIKNLDMNSTKTTPDAVLILPYFKKDGKTYIMAIREFRQPLNKYAYGTPAGCVEAGEDPEKTAIRELYEETGAHAVKLELAEKAGYSTAGLTDESIACYFAQIDSVGAQHLEADEDITPKVVELDDIPEFLNSGSFCLPNKMLIREFYYREKINELTKVKDEGKQK